MMRGVALRPALHPGSGITAAAQLIVAAAFALLYEPVVVGLAAQWNVDRTFQYGYFIPLVSAYLAWELRTKLRAAPAAGAAAGLAVFAAAMALLVLGRAGGVAFVERISIVPALFGVALYLWGWARTRLLAFPIAFLALMVPVPLPVLARMTWPLQVFTAKFSSEALSFFGVPVFLNGVYIDLPYVRLHVAEACSGFNYMIALLATSILMASMTQDRWRERLLLVGSVVPISIIANAIRVTLIIVFGVWGDHPMHEGSGWIVFVIATGLLMWLSGRMTRAAKPEREAVSEASAV
jgi:exosortase